MAETKVMNAVKFSLENAANAVLDAMTLDLRARIGRMSEDGEHALVLWATGLSMEKIEYPKAVRPGDFVIVREQTW